MKKSLKSSDKLKLRSEFARVRESDSKAVGKLMILGFAPVEDGQKLKAGVVCSRKYSNKAVERNRARRLLWESFRLLKKNIKAVHLVMIPRWRMKDSDMFTVKEEMGRLLRNCELWQDSDE